MNTTALDMADEILLRLPFDQYGRYRMVREAVEAARVALGRAPTAYGARLYVAGDRCISATRQRI